MAARAFLAITHPSLPYRVENQTVAARTSYLLDEDFNPLTVLFVLDLDQLAGGA